MGKYVLGVDFGTLSGRAVLVDTATGAVLGQEAENYRSGRWISGSEGRGTSHGAYRTGNGEAGCGGRDGV